MRKAIPILLALIIALGTAACGGGTNTETPGSPANPPASSDANLSLTQSTNTPAPPEAVELIVFAAASMTDTLEEIAILYKTVAPHVTLVFNFDSSGTLKTQIENGAAADLFISAAQRQMNELQDLDLVLTDTRVDILENKVVLVTAPGNPRNITSFDALVDALLGGSILLAIGNSDVPVGQYTINIFSYYDLDEDALARSGVLTYASNVREVTTQVREASVDAGIVYATDAFSTNLDIAGNATLAMAGGQVIYPAAVLNIASNVQAAQAFLDYLTTPPAIAVFESVGFTPVT
jgi:molybdate transport system substrate-binding protein